MKNKAPETVGSVISISKGKKHSISESPSDRSKRVLSIDDLRNDQLIRYTDDKKGTEVNPNDVMIAWDGANAGTIGYGKSGFIGSTIARIRIKDLTKLDAHFMGMYLQSKFGYLRKTATGATIPHINRHALEKIPLPKVGINDQVRIAHILGKVEALIAQRKKQLLQLDELLKSVFLDMFGDPVRNEKGWETKNLGELVTIERGRFSPRPRNDPRYFNGEHPYIQTGDINRSNGRLKEYTQTLNDIGTKVSKEFEIGTIVIAIVGATIGETAILEISTYAPDSVIGLSLKNNRNDKYAIFIEYILRFWKPILRARAPEAARANINIETLRPLPIISPAIEDAEKFINLYIKVERVESQYRKSLSNLELLYSSLSQKAFKGELDLSAVPLPESLGQDSSHIKSSVANDAPLVSGFSKLDEYPMDSPEGRERLLQQWFFAFIHGKSTPDYSLDEFWRSVQFKLVDYTSGESLNDEAPVTGFNSADYDQLKEWVFAQVRSGELAQTYNESSNSLQLQVLTE